MKVEEITEQFLWEERLAPLLGYLPPDQINRVREALSLAYDAHSIQRRKSGEPFITHPVEVTRILAELKMDYESLAAGLLHDTVEDCETVGLEEIGFHFGPAVQRIVEGETKFSKLPTHHPEREAAAAAAAENGNSNGATAVTTPTIAPVDVCATPTNTTTSEDTSTASQSDAKAQDLQFLFLAMTEEVRIIVVKLADRLHNMRTMASMPPGKQRRIAQETLSVFAPLARLLGLYTIKEELEDLSFMYAMPQQYAVMRKSVDRLWEQQSPAVEAAAAELRRFLAEDAFLSAKLRGMRIEVTRKAMYSSWRKLQANAKSVRDVSEIAQLRVLVDTAPADGGAFDRQLCYHVMGLVHSHWAPVPGSMKDYIATPKPNNYQSLHTTVLPTGLRAAAAAAASGNGSSGASSIGGKITSTLFPIEVQIRTQQMERLAQYGIAVESWSCADYARAVGAERPPIEYPPGSLNSTSSTTSNGNGSQNGASNGKTSRKLNGALSWLNIGAFLTGNGATGSTASAGSISSESDTEGLSSDSDSNSNGATNGATAAQSNGSDNKNSNNGNGSNGASYSSYSNRNGSSSSSSSNNGSPSGSAIIYPNGTTTAPTASSSTTTTPPGSRLDSQSMSRRINWLNSIRQWQEEFVGTLTAQEFVACVTDDLLGQGVFVFTPSGQVMRLPKGATVVDFAYHIHTDIGNTMVAAKVNGTIVNADHELANAEVVEVITYKGPPNATVIKRHQKWLASAKTKSARIKLAKFLREHAALAASVGLLAPGDSAMGEAQRGGGPGSAAGAGVGTDQAVWLLARCDDRQGLLAAISNVITRHGHNIRSYSGSTDRDAGLFVMEYELEGPSDELGALCEDLSTVDSVQGWECGCALPSATRKRRSQRL